MPNDVSKKEFASNTSLPNPKTSASLVTVIEINEEDEEKKIDILNTSHNNNDNNNNNNKRREPRCIDPNKTMEELKIPHNDNNNNALVWRKQLRQRWELPKLNTSNLIKHRESSSRSRSKSPKENINNNNKQNKETSSPPSLISTSSPSSPPPNKALLESPKKQIGIYRFLKKREFVTLHEELHHLRMTNIHYQKTLKLRSEELTRLHKDLEDKCKEIERLKALLELLRKKKGLPMIDNSELEEHINNIEFLQGTPSLSLFAAIANNNNNNNNNNCSGRGAPAKMLLELRQNIASRDTIIDNLRMEIVLLRKSFKEGEEKKKHMATELEEIRTQCVNLTAELSVKNAKIEELEKLHNKQNLISEENTSSNNNNNNNSPNTIKSNCDTMSETQQQHNNNNNSQQKQDKYEELWSELNHLRRSLEREKEINNNNNNIKNNNSDWEYRRRHESEQRITNTELETFKNETEAYKRELGRMQKLLTTYSFADVQLQAARNENDILNQRVLELREENSLHAARERELRNDMLMIKESYNRREDELISLQRRLKTSKESERGMREEIEILEERLARAELRLRTATQFETIKEENNNNNNNNNNRNEEYDMSSYAALMAYNTELQEKQKVLELELEEAKNNNNNNNNNTFSKMHESSSDMIESIDQIGKEISELKGKLEQNGEFLVQLQKQVYNSSISNENLLIELQNTRELYSTLSQELNKIVQQMVILEEIKNSIPAAIDNNNNNNNNNNNKSKTLLLEESKDIDIINQPTPKKKDYKRGIVRSRLEEIQRQSIISAESSIISNSTTSSHYHICNYKEELEKSQIQIENLKSELDKLQKQQLTFEALKRETTGRKASSLRAARIELAEGQQELIKYKLIIEELQKKCEEQENIIKQFKETLPPSSSSSFLPLSSSALCNNNNNNENNNDKNNDNSKSKLTWDEEDYHIIEEALRQETVRLDAEMYTLRHEIYETKLERDHWKALATGIVSVEKEIIDSKTK